MRATLAATDSVTEAMLSPLRVLLVDNDGVARKDVAGMLAVYPSHPVVRQCASGFEALTEIRSFKPHVLICEIEVPGIDGFSLLETVAPQNRPSTIYLSAHDHFAVRAFEVSAVDYIIKPVERERFLKAYERARNQIETRNAAQYRAVQRAKQLIIRSGRSVIFVRPEELDYAEAEGKYVRLHVGKEVLVLKMSITALEAELNPAQFVRIHRSTLINIDRVRRVQPWDHRRTYQVTLQDGTRLVLSRKSRLLEISGKPLTVLPL